MRRPGKSKRRQGDDAIQTLDISALKGPQESTARPGSGVSQRSIRTSTPSGKEDDEELQAQPRKDKDKRSQKRSKQQSNFQLAGVEVDFAEKMIAIERRMDTLEKKFSDPSLLTSNNRRTPVSKNMSQTMKPPAFTGAGGSFFAGSFARKNSKQGARSPHDSKKTSVGFEQRAESKETSLDSKMPGGSNEMRETRGEIISVTPFHSNDVSPSPPPHPAEIPEENMEAMAGGEEGGSLPPIKRASPFPLTMKQHIQ